MTRDLMQLEIRHFPDSAPAEWEVCGERRTDPADVIADYERLSHAYRCGKQFRVTTSDGNVDILDFLHAHCGRGAS